MAQIIDGKKIADSIYERIKRNSFTPYEPKLTIVQVGDNPASNVFIKIKRARADELGIDTKLVKFSDTITQNDLKTKIQKLAKDVNNTGILVQLPLPNHFVTQEVIDCIPAEKDVDGLTSTSLGSIGTGQYLPAVVGAVEEALDSLDTEYTGAKVTVIGGGKHVGLPIANYLSFLGATVTICNEFTENIKEFSLKSDIVITAVGKPQIFDKSYFCNDSVVVDVGTSKDTAGKIVGDVNFVDVEPYVKAITPVLGGIGPVTVSVLLEQLIKAHINSEN